MTHTLIQRGPKDWYCSVCRQQWTSPSKAWCPGVPVIAYKDRGPLMSQTEMDKRGYKTDALPISTCCYRMNTKHAEVLYVPLYDPSGCARKKVVKRKLVHYVDALHWPLAWMPFLERLVAWKDEHMGRKTETAQTVEEAGIEADARWERLQEWHDLCFEVARMTSCLLVFTADEVAALGDTVTFTFDLMPIRLTWESRSPSIRQRDDLIDMLLGRYRGWRYASRSPDEIAAQQTAAAEITARRVAEQRAEEAVRRAKLFEPVEWMTQDEALPPAVQKPLFEEEV